MQDPYNGRVLLAAVICLSVVVLFVILLHLYGRWLLRRSSAAYVTSEFADFHRRRRSSADEPAVISSSGLDSTAVAALPLFVYNEMERKGEKVECVVCLSSMEEGEKGRFLPRCGHGFHAGCIDVWLAANSGCPICRTPAAAAVVAVEEEEEEVVVVEMDEGEKEEASSSMVSGSLKRMLSRSRSGNRVFPSVLEN